MPAKRDLSRLVMLNLTPSEAVIVAGALEAIRIMAPEADCHGILSDAIARISLQMQLWALPADESKKAPFPL
jgi:hypothetical protein